MGFIFALIAIGLTLIYGVMNVVNFAHGEFLMVGMYATYLAFATWGVDPLVSLPFVAALMFGFGLLVYYLLIRKVLTGSMQSQIFATFGLIVFLQAGAQYFMGADYFAVRESWLSGVLTIGDAILPLPQLAALVGASVATLLLYLLVFRTPVGRQLRPARRTAKPHRRSGSMPRACTRSPGESARRASASPLRCSPTYPVFFRGWARYSCSSPMSSSPSAASAPSMVQLVAGLLVGLLQVATGFFVSSELKYVPVYALYLIVVLLRPRGLFGRA